MRKGSRASVHLDALRAAAAIIVVFCHWRYAMFADQPSFTFTQKVVFSPVCFMAWAAPLAVMVFFVLSGYLVSGSVLRTMRGGDFSLRVYGCHRLIRLWVVLIPALLVGGLVDFVGLHHHAAYALYTGHVLNHEAVNVFDRFNGTAFLSSLAFLQTIHGKVFGSNVPLWSVAFEFWYYVLFPLGFVALSSRFSLVRRVVCTVGFAAVAALVGLPVLELFPLWLLGFGIHYLPKLSLSRVQRSGLVLVYGVVFVAMVIATRVPSLGSMYLGIRYVVGIATALLIWVLLSSTETSQKSLYTRTASSLAGFSYTLYASHFPILMLFTAFLLGSHRWNPTPVHIVTSLGGVASAFLVAFALHKTFEVRTPVLQKAAERMVKHPFTLREPRTVTFRPSHVDLSVRYRTARSK